MKAPKLPGINHLEAVRALEKAGFRVARRGKHIFMTDGARILAVPRHIPVNGFTMGGIVRDAGLRSTNSGVCSNKVPMQSASTIAADRQVIGLRARLLE